ncbi:MAG: histidinol dehydrogenase [Cyclobacteriaceae bacterium]|nr:histidinol dehydrogenase [Cyclobacteriaceae bacterium]MDW8331683.1 histidinol dehydrogenase [Cyclobacteriaceae bacterium]
MRIFTEPDRKIWQQLCSRPQLELEFLESTVRNILLRVKKSGDAALREFAKQYDGIELNTLEVSHEERIHAAQSVGAALAQAIQLAASNIEKFHRTQLKQQSPIETMPGVVCWRKAIPLRRVGIYIPGGTAPLFSTVLMLAIPARIAGCDEVILCTPPDKNGKVNPAILYAAELAGVSKIFKTGGAQAIAALAYGTETIPATDKIFGPGNQYVTKAKEMVSREGISIDLPAGPSEVLVWADDTANPAFAAADLLSQAEHGTDSQVMLVCNQNQTAEAILSALEKQLETLPRKEIAEQALMNSRAIIFSRDEDALDFINSYAPEHLIINTRHAESKAGRIRNAGSVFVGPYSPEAAGDYASGTNHTLPTNGFARTFGGVSTESFIKYITFQQITREGIQNLGPAVMEMAQAEHLEGHARAIAIRLNDLQK